MRRGLLAVLITLFLLPGSALAYRSGALDRIARVLDDFLSPVVDAQYTSPPTPTAFATAQPVEPASTVAEAAPQQIPAADAARVSAPFYAQLPTGTDANASPLPSDDLVHTSLLAAALAAFESKIDAQISAITKPPAFPQQVAAGGNGIFSYGAAAAASSYVPSVVSAAPTTFSAISGSLNLGSQVSGTLAIANGGTGLASAPIYGQLLMGQSNGTYALVSTSTLNISGGGGSGTVSSGTQGQFAFYNAAGTTLAATSSLFLAQSGNIGIGTTSPFTTLSVNGTGYFNNSLTAADGLVLANNYLQNCTSFATDLAGNLSCNMHSYASTSSIPNVIMDSDFETDGDDLAALALLNTFADYGQANILAIMHNTSLTVGAYAEQAVNTFYGRGNIPIGQLSDPGVYASEAYSTYLSQTFPNTLSTTHATVDATTLYRKVLAGQPDNSVTIVSIGLLRNIYNLYNSPGDSISPLTGAQLLSKKVKQLVVMGGDYPTGNEHNFNTDPTSTQVINTISTNFPNLQIIYIGYTLGNNVNINVSAAPVNSPLYKGFQYLGYSSHPSWDVLATLYTVLGLSDGTNTLFSLSGAGSNSVNGSGVNTFTTGAGNQYYLVAATTTAALGNELNTYLDRAPVNIGQQTNSSSIWSMLNSNAYFAGTGNIGIGTSTPNTPLEVSGSGRILQLSRPNTQYAFGLNISSSGVSSIWDQANTAERLQISQGGTVTFPGTLAASSYVGIGTSSPATPLEISSAGGRVIQISRGGSYPWGLNDSGSGIFSIWDQGQSADRLKIDQSGNVGVQVLAAGTANALCYNSGIISGVNVLSTCSSDKRLKQNVTPLDASSTLDEIMRLRPVSFNWNPAFASSTELQFGLIAQDVQQIWPNLVSTTSPTALTPDGTLSINFNGLYAPIIKAIQEIASISGTFKTNLIAFLGSATNGLTDLFAAIGHFGEVHAADKLCVGPGPSETCVTQQQLAALLSQSAASSLSTSVTSSSGGQVTNSETAGNANSTTTNTITTPPVISINGANPATIPVGSTYADLGATITAPQGDLNLGLTIVVGNATSTDGTVQIDTSTPGTHAILYTVTDPNGLTGSATRTVIVSAPQQTPPPANDNTTTTAANDNSPSDGATGTTGQQ